MGRETKLIPGLKKIFLDESKAKLSGYSEKKISSKIFLFNTTILFCLIAFFIMHSLKSSGLEARGNLFTHISAYKAVFIKGYLLTLLFSICILVGSLLFGVALWFFDTSKFVLLRVAVYWTIQVCRGTPIMVFLVFLYYVVGQFLGVQNRNIAAVLILSIYYSTAISEIIRGGFRSIPSIQFEVADGFGLTPFQTYFHVILPQLVQRILPSLTNQIGIIIQGSSLASIIGVVEFYQTATQVASQTYAVFECYILLAIGYLSITIPISFLTKLLERNHGRV